MNRNLLAALGIAGVTLAAACGGGVQTTPLAPTTVFASSGGINPTVATAITPVATFANGLPTIMYKTAATGTLALTFKDASNTVIPATNSSAFLTPVTLTASDPHVTFAGTINNASQTAQISYDGNAAVAATFTVTAKAGTTTIGTFTMKTAGYLYEIATSGAGSQPFGITTGPDGQLWYVEYASNKIGRVNFPSPYTLPPTSITTSQFPIPTASTGPFYIAAGPSGDSHMWFTEVDGTNIGTVDTSVPVPTPQETSAAGDFNGVAALSPYMYIVAQDANALNRYNASRIFVGPAATLGVGCTPQAVAVGADNNLWVTCGGTNNVYSVDPTSMVSTPWAASARQAAIAAGPDNAVWFGEQNQKIGRISTTTHAFSEYAIPGGPYALGIVKGPDGAMWFTEPGANKIGRIDVTTKQIVEFPVTTSASSPAGITAGPDGWIWFTETGSGKIGRMQPAF